MIKSYDDTSVESIVALAKSFVGKSLSKILDEESLTTIQTEILKYSGRRKGLFGDLIEEHLFDIKNNNIAAADFSKVGIELKTTPLKRHPKKKYAAKERLVFSMINYEDIIHETWDSSSFLKKNKLLLLMFYLYEPDITLVEYRFKLVHLLNLLSDISVADKAQIERDWNVIVNKVKAGEAHLLSEADTSYLSAATKASKATDRRPQPNNSEPAKPRAFSFKPSYLNSIIQNYLHQKEGNTVSLIGDTRLPLTIEENMLARFQPYIGRTNFELESELGITYERNRPKHHRRLLVNKLLGVGTSKIEELEKANITMRVIALESSGVLRESISFPYFNYEEVVQETWEESEFYEQLTTRRFLFITFRKQDTDVSILEGIQFWNFPVSDLEQTKWVWEETVKRINNKQAGKLPSIKENPVAHVRPHGRVGKDVLPTGYGTFETKKCFWLNAKYIKTQLSQTEGEKHE